MGGSINGASYRGYNRGDDDATSNTEVPGGVTDWLCNVLVLELFFAPFSLSLSLSSLPWSLLDDIRGRRLGNAKGLADALRVGALKLAGEEDRGVGG